jgi:hypothetical protein
MTFPNDFWMHPKVAPLPVEAKWTFVEMNGYSRMQDLDGVIPAVMAERLWSRDVLQTLVASDPVKPLVVWDVDSYVIRDYAEHQQTTAERDELSRKRSEAGARGRAKQLSDSSRASVGQVPGQIRAETETESKTSKRTSVQAELEREFDEFWKVYPRKEGKQAAKRRYVTARRSYPAEVIFKGAQAYALMSLGKDKQFVKMAQGWLGDGRFEDASGPATSPLAPRSLTPAEHSHKWLADGTCTLCSAKRDREDTW